MNLPQCSLVLSYTDAASKYPDNKVVFANMGVIAASAFEKVKNSISCGEDGAKFREVLAHIERLSLQEWENFIKPLFSCFLDKIKPQEFLLPSKLYPYLFQRVEEIFSNAEEYDSLVALLHVPTDLSSNVIDQFMLGFAMTVPREMVKFISKSVRDVVIRDPVGELDAEDKEVVHYIAGSIFRGYYRIAYRHKKNPKWCSIMDAIKNCIVTKDATQEAAAWTKNIDKGGLLYITKRCQEFSEGLTKVIFQCENHDGSINYGKVLNIVSASRLVNDWDEMLSGSLPSQISVNLMNDFIKNLCQTCARGFAKKRLNKLRQKPLVSMNLRHQVKCSNQKKK